MDHRRFHDSVKLSARGTGASMLAGEKVQCPPELLAAYPDLLGPFVELSSGSRSERPAAR